MEILFVTHKYPPSIGGMENQSFHLIDQVSKYAKVHKIVYDGHGSVFTFYLGLKKKIKETLANNPNIKVVHCNDGTIGVICSWLRSYPNIKLCVTLHGLDVVFPSFVFQKVLMDRLRSFDLIITVSNATKTECLKRGFEENKLVVVANGVDHSLTTIPSDQSIYIKLLDDNVKDLEDKKIIVSLGRAVPRKGFSWFIENVVAKLPSEFIYVMIGPFERKAGLKENVFNLLPSFLTRKLALLFGWPMDQKALRILLEDANLKNRVFHLGKLPYKEMLSGLSEADVFVMPNIKIEGDLEGFGLVALEASLRGTKVLASKIEGIQDAIHHNKNGLLISSQESQLWIDAIKSINYSESKCESAVAYTKRVFSWERMGAEYLKEFERIESLENVKVEFEGNKVVYKEAVAR